MSLRDRPRESSALRQEPVSRMHRLRAAPLRRIDQPLDVQITLRCRSRAHVIRLVRETGVQRLPVRVGVDGDARNAHLPKSPDDADGDLAAVGDQNLLEHPQVLPSQLPLSKRISTFPSISGTDWSTDEQAWGSG